VLSPGKARYFHLLHKTKAFGKTLCIVVSAGVEEANLDGSGRSGAAFAEDPDHGEQLGVRGELQVGRLPTARGRFQPGQSRGSNPVFLSAR
jgi:hypothetical protein